MWRKRDTRLILKMKKAKKMSKRNKAKNTTQIVKGKIDEAAGRVSGNDRLEEDGKVDQMMGNLKQGSEDIKDAVKK
jgi:uncharacterized protein YjbJ (UPF0337 family)